MAAMQLKKWIYVNEVKNKPTCFKETGKVSFPETSGLCTMFLHISRHALQTEAQATTFLRAGQLLSLASNLLTTSHSSSGGKLAQRLFWTKTWSSNSWTKPCDFLASFTSKLLLDKLPNPSRTSRIMLRNDMSKWHLKLQCLGCKNKKTNRTTVSQMINHQIIKHNKKRDSNP